MNYKVTRIGLINFWYFDEEEFEFSDGKILLRGENGSGKSVTMQSFIPLILDGNKAPNRLDPFGSKEKRIEDYLLGPSDGFQKDDATGYLYMEVYEETLDKYITIGMGLRARKGQGTDFWGFALKDGKRIGEDFHLYKDYNQKVLLTKKELRARLGTTNEYTESTKEYKAIVNQLLFGFKELDAYDEFINVLLQLRSSKLSKDYTPTKLMGILSSVLQPLTEDDVRPISEAIEDTNKTRERVETLERQVKALTNLLKTYQNYNDINLYQKAFSVKEKSDFIKNREKVISDSEKELMNLKNRLSEIGIQVEQLDKELLDNIARLETIDNKDLKQITKEHANIKEDIDKVNGNIKIIKNKLENFMEKEKAVAQKIKEYEDKRYQNEQEVVAVCDDINELSDEVKLFDIHTAVGKIVKNEEANFEYLEERVTKYKSKINQIKNKLEEKERIEMDLNRIEEEHQQKRKETEEKEKDLKVEEKKLREQIDVFKNQIHLLDKENQILKIEQENKNHIFTFIDDYSNENYQKASLEYQKIAKYYETKALEEKNNLNHKIDLEEKERDSLKEELTILQNQKELELEEDIEIMSLLQSSNIPFLPFYKAVEFLDHINDFERNRLEELLLQINILNAKIVPQKYLQSVKEIGTVFLKAGKKKNHNLLKYFKVVENEIVSKEEITAILESISIEQTEEIYFSPSSYQLDFIIGYPGKQYESKYIGILKRIEEQKRKILEKEEEITVKETIIRNYQNLLNSAIKRLELIELEASNFPSNQELQSTKEKIHDTLISLQILANQDKELMDKITEFTKQIELKIKEINNLKENISIPLNLASYKNVLVLIDELMNKIYILKNVYHSLQLSLEQKESNQNMLEETRADINYQNEELTDKTRELDKLTSKKKAIEDMLSNPDYQKLIEELQILTKRQNEIPEEKMKLVEEKGTLLHSLSTVESTLLEAKDLLVKDTAELELRQFILEKEYSLHYVYQEEPLDVAKILKDLENRKNSDSNRALVNYLEAYNTYRLELLEYRLNTKTIFNKNEELIEKYVEKGLDSTFVETLMNNSSRQDMTSIYQGKIINIYTLEQCLKEAIIESESYINQQERHLFEDILLKTVGNKIRDKIEASKEWVSKMNDIMKNTQIDSNLSFQLEWKSKVAFTEDELDTKELVRLFKIDAGQLRHEDSKKLRNHFQSQIKKELEYSEKTHESYTSIISRVLDYRNWFEFKLYYQRKSGERKELTNKVFFVLSGGERAKSMYVPLFASVYAKLLTARPDSLRLIALDEAFAGVDNGNVREMFAILSQLNLDYILTSQALWGDYESIASMSICELIKDEVQKAVAVRHYHWNGHAIELLEKFGGHELHE